MRERLLTQHFLQRFLENDLLSPEADRHDAIAMACGGLLTLGLFVSIGMSMQFLFMPFQSPGRTAMLAMGDRLFFVAISMIVMALVAVLTWDALSLDARDTAMFGPLPIERGLIVRAKLRAVGILAGGFALAISSLSSVFHPSLMVAKLSIGLIPAVALIVIHLAITLAAGLFAFASVVVVREALRAVLGMRFTRVSAGLQAVMIISLVTSFLLLPAILDRARPDQRQARLLPPIWFVALHEALAGDLVAGLPRGELPGSIARQEDVAAARYRQIAPILRPLAWRAVIALLRVAVDCHRRVLLELPPAAVAAGRQAGGQVSRPSLFTRAMTLTLVRRRATQAGFFFTMQCIFRSGPHRVVMAGCTAVSIALATVFLTAGGRWPAGDLASVPGYVLSTQTMALAVLLAGFRHVTRLPADISANRLFRLAWVADSGRFLAGVRRGAWSPSSFRRSLHCCPPYLYLLGTRLALMHALSGFLLGAAAISLMSLRTNQLPFVASYAPARRPEHGGTGHPDRRPDQRVDHSRRIERFALADLQSAAILWGILAAAPCSRNWPPAETRSSICPAHSTCLRRGRRGWIWVMKQFPVSSFQFTSLTNYWQLATANCQRPRQCISTSQVPNPPR